jgi:hypothetical protein
LFDLLVVQFAVFADSPDWNLSTGQNREDAHGRMHPGRARIHGDMGGPSMPMGPELCPEYTLVSDKVVFVIVGKSSNSLIPLAETIDFRFHKNELAVRVNDAKRETKFDIKDMVMRSEWDRVQRHIEEKLKESDDREAEVRLH